MFKILKGFSKKFIGDSKITFTRWGNDSKLSGYKDIDIIEGNLTWDYEIDFTAEQISDIKIALLGLYAIIRTDIGDTDIYVDLSNWDVLRSHKIDTLTNSVILDKVFLNFEKQQITIMVK